MEKDYYAGLGATTALDVAEAEYRFNQAGWRDEALPNHLRAVRQIWAT